MTDTAAVEMPVFNEALIKQFTPMINKLIKKYAAGYNTSDVCYEWDDLFQECVIHLNEAVKLYDPSRGMKFSNFAWLVFSSKLMNFKTKYKKKNYKTLNFSSIPGGWSITGSEVSEEGESLFSNKFESIVEVNSTEISNQLLDAKNVYERLKGDRKKIYAEHFILGKSVGEIHKNSLFKNTLKNVQFVPCEEFNKLKPFNFKNPEIKPHQIRKIINHLNKIHSTLVEGNLSCLQ